MLISYKEQTGLILDIASALSGPTRTYSKACKKICLFVYFHLIPFTIKDNKINGYNKNKTMTKLKKNYIY